jgi:hypothetical protein
MDTLESTTQSFIVKVWVEEIAEETGQGVWHGHISLDMRNPESAPTTLSIDQRTSLQSSYTSYMD